MKKMIDQNGRLFGLINALDVVVLLLVVVLACAVAVKATRHPTSAENNGEGLNVPITYTVVVQALPENVMPYLNVGDKVYDEGQPALGSLGTISAISFEDAFRNATLSDGTLISVPSEGYTRATITIESTGALKDGRYQINGFYDIGVNAKRTFCNKYTNFPLCVTEIH